MEMDENFEGEDGADDPASPRGGVFAPMQRNLDCKTAPKL
jgi:hypothetical protein